MPVYQFDCTGCGESTDVLMKYSEREAGITCDCGSHAGAVITACQIKPSLGGAHKGRIMAPDVGPLSKKTKAYQKKKDDENSKFYAPDQTFGTGGVNGFKARQIKRNEMKQGKTNFTK